MWRFYFLTKIKSYKMSWFKTVKSFFIKESTKYTNAKDSVIVACYFNPQKSAYRKIAFDKFYDSIKHLNFRIIECTIDGSAPELLGYDGVVQIDTKNMLWHKETLLNKLIKNLPTQFTKVFWIDADVIFTNKNWLVEGSRVLDYCSIVQPFKYCVHLEQDEIAPNPTQFEQLKQTTFDKIAEKRKVWHSFAYAHAKHLLFGSQKDNYDMHGHVGFAWGARREILEKVPLYDKALIGGADHIIAHACVGEIPCSCIRKTFTEDIENVETWMKRFHSACNGLIGYVEGDLYHIWHGDIEKRDYYNRVKKFTPISKEIQHRDNNGFFTTNPTVDTQVRHYFSTREVESDVSFFDNSTTIVETSIQQESVPVVDNFTGFGGGDFGGGGAGSEWSSDVNGNNFS